MKILLYHITPAVNSVFFWNIGKLLERIHLFDKIFIAVAVGESISTAEGTVPLMPLEYVRSLFQHIPNVTFGQFNNDSSHRESVSFEWLMKQAAHWPDATTFYAHSKGLTRGNNTAVRLWTEAMYDHLLAPTYLPKVEQYLEKYPIVGCFKRCRRSADQWPDFPKESNYHFSGTFWWFRNVDMFSRPWRENIRLGRYEVEAYPSMIFDRSEAGCPFADHAGNPFDLRYLQRLGLLDS